MNYERTIKDIIKETKEKFKDKERLLTDDYISHMEWYINQYNTDELNRLLEIVEYKLNSYTYKDSFSFGAYGLTGLTILLSMLDVEEMRNNNLALWAMIVLIIFYFCILFFGFNYIQNANKSDNIEKNILVGLKIAIKEKISKIMSKELE